MPRCPLLPYLFLLCAEAFSSLISGAESMRCLNWCPRVTHLLFVDDSIIFSDIDSIYEGDPHDL